MIIDGENKKDLDFAILKIEKLLDDMQGKEIDYITCEPCNTIK